MNKCTDEDLIEMYEEGSEPVGAGTATKRWALCVAIVSAVVAATVIVRRNSRKPGAIMSRCMKAIERLEDQVWKSSTNLRA
jgi:hypothetical protein